MFAAVAKGKVVLHSWGGGTSRSLLLSASQDEELRYINSILTRVFLLLPHYCLGRGLIDMARNQLVADAFAALGG